MRSLSLALALLVAAVVPAAATGSFSCEANDASVRFTAESLITRGMGSPFLNFTARLDIASDELAADLRSMELDRALVHHWLTDSELRLHFYRERNEAPHAYIELFVLTRFEEDEMGYRGEYVLTVYDGTGSTDGVGRTITLRGSAGCAVD